MHARQTCPTWQFLPEGRYSWTLPHGLYSSGMLLCVVQSMSPLQDERLQKAMSSPLQHLGYAHTSRVSVPRFSSFPVLGNTVSPAGRDSMGTAPLFLEIKGSSSPPGEGLSPRILVGRPVCLPRLLGCTCLPIALNTNKGKPHGVKNTKRDGTGSMHAWCRV